MQNKLSFNQILYSVLIFIGIIWVLLTLSPSSYYQNAINNTKLLDFVEPPIFGKPQPIRSDEYRVWTPLIQIAVNNNFERFNETSPYNEDLRAWSFLPLKDWALVFKPQMWAFHILPPSYAYSLYFYIVFTAFIVGWLFLFKKLGFSNFESLIFSALLYYTGYVQFWYVIYAPQFAMLPYIYLSLSNIKNNFIRFPLFYYTLCVFTFSSLYIPSVLTLGALVSILLIIFNRNLIKINFVFFSLVFFGLFILTYYAYVRDFFDVINSTAYPGKRAFDNSYDASGMYLNYLSYILPGLFVFDFFPGVTNNGAIGLSYSNICETSVVSSSIILILFFFSKFDSLKKSYKKNEQSLILLFSFAMFIFLFSTYNLPNIFYKIPYTNSLPPERWQGLFGILIFMISMFLYKNSEFELTKKRFIIFVFFTFIIGFVLKLFLAKNVLIWWYDLAILFFITCLFFINKTKREKYLKELLLIAVLLSNLFTFGLFNPIQPAKSIFSAKNSSYVNELKNNPENYNSQGFFIGEYIGGGAVANGLGLKSISHTNIIPQLDFFKEYFSEMNEEEFNFMFNRYLNIDVFNKKEMNKLINSYKKNKEIKKLFIHKERGLKFLGPKKDKKYHQFIDLVVLPSEAFK